ncbi:hypothetical protein ACFQ51_32405 [Streptomyces kaempferi]
MPATGDWQTWATVATHVVLPAGRQVLTLHQDTGGWNINHLGFAAGSGSPSATLTTSPGSLTFAYQALNTTSAAQTVTVTNSGTATASITGVTAAVTSRRATPAAPPWPPERTARSPSPSNPPPPALAPASSP